MQEVGKPKDGITAVKMMIMNDEFRTRASELQKEVDQHRKRFQAFELRVKILGFGIAILFFGFVLAVLYSTITNGGKISLLEEKATVPSTAAHVPLSDAPVPSTTAL